MSKGDFAGRRHKEQQWTLNAAEKDAGWVDDGKRDHISLDETLSHLDSESGHYRAMKMRDGTVRIYNLDSGDRIEDRWLESAFADFQNRKELSNHHGYLTDDLKYLVVFPLTWNRGSEGTVTDFVLNGEKYRCDSHYLVYARPEATPRVFSGMRYRESALETFKPLSIDGKLLFLEYSDQQLILRNLENEVVYSHQFTERVRWLNRDSSTWTHVVQVQYDPQANRVVFTASPILSIFSDEQKDDCVYVLAWHLNDQKTKLCFLHTRDLFDLKGDGYYPKQTIRVQD